jgi:ankyrin repeat protein
MKLGGKPAADASTPARRWTWLLPLVLVAVPSAAGPDLRLIEAAKHQDSQMVRALLSERVDVNTEEPDGATSLHWAAYWDDDETVDLLIRAGANVNAANDLGVTPLFLAGSNGNASVVQKLLIAGANANAAHISGVTPLMRAARVGSVGAVKALLAHGAEVNAKETAHRQTALMWAAAYRHADVVRLLSEQGGDIHARSATRELLVNRVHQESTQSAGSTEWIQAAGYTPLLFAAVQGHLESASVLLSAGANPNDTAADGSSALALAAFAGYSEVAELLLEKGADPNAAGSGYAPLHAAVLRGDLGLVKALLARGANPNAQLAKGTPVRRYGWNFVLTQRLVGATPYLLAAKYLESDIMRVLAAAGADSRSPMKDGTTPLMAAAGLGGDGGAGSFNRREQRQAEDNVRVADDPVRALEAARVAIEMGADVNATNLNGDTALHGAAARGLNEVLRLLVERGANLDVRNRRGQTPLAMTSGRRFGESVSDETDESLVSTAELLRTLGAKEERR